MTRPRAPRLLAASVALTLSIGLAGCVPDADADAPAGAASSTNSPEPSTAAPTETSEAPAIGTSCEDVLAPEAYAELDADGLETREPDLNDPIAQQIADEAGIACTWVKPQTDNILELAHATGVDEAAWSRTLTEAGYTQTDDPVPGAWTGPVEPGTGLSPVVVLADSTIVFVSAPAFAQWIRAGS